MRKKTKRRKIRLAVRKIRFKIRPGDKEKVIVRKPKTGPRGGRYVTIDGEKKYLSQMTELKSVEDPRHRRMRKRGD